jgi:hypothetical protein
MAVRIGPASSTRQMSRSGRYGRSLL